MRAQSRLVAILAVVVLATGAAPLLRAQGAPCDRECLIGFVDRYLDALVRHDPAGLPLANEVKFTENTATISIGDGLWVGASDLPTTFRIYVADPKAGQVGFFGVLKEFGDPVLLALRLKVVNRQITEIEHVLDRDLTEEGMPNLVTPRPALLEKVPPEKRNSRADMLCIANSYFDAIEQDKGSVAPFADDCTRIENGVQTTTKAPPNPDDYGPSDADQLRFARATIRSLGCSKQLDTQVMSYITWIRPRRLWIVDEELGIVYGFPTFVHRGVVRIVDVVGVPGVKKYPRETGPFNFQAGEMFKIWGGQIHEVEANGFILPYGSGNGWE